MLVMRLLRGLVSASALTAMLLVAGAAQAVGTFDSLNGGFTFTNFSITGSADALANYSIEATENGFDIILANDGLTVSGSARDLAVQYDVISDFGPITQAFLSFEASFTGFGSLATVSEDYFTEVGGDLIPPGLVVYTNFAASQFEDSQSIPGYSSLHVKKDILKIVVEEVPGLFFHTLESVNRETLPSVFGKYIAAVKKASNADKEIEVPMGRRPVDDVEVTELARALLNDK